MFNPQAGVRFAVYYDGRGGVLPTPLIHLFRQKVVLQRSLPTRTAAENVCPTWAKVIIDPMSIKR
jgi:hypothetical protein